MFEAESWEELIREESDHTDNSDVNLMISIERINRIAHFQSTLAFRVFPENSS